MYPSLLVHAFYLLDDGDDITPSLDVAHNALRVFHIGLLTLMTNERRRPEGLPGSAFPVQFPSDEMLDEYSSTFVSFL